MDDAPFLDALGSRLVDGYWPDLVATTGTDVDIRVTGVRAVADGPWPEVEVSYAVAPVGRPEVCGLLRRPIDPDWRRLSRYDDPDVYAEALARDVGHAAWDLLRFPDGRPPPHRSGVPVEVAWRGFLSSLSGYGVVRQTGPGRVEVRRHDDTLVTFLVTPEQWARIGPEIEEYPLGLHGIVGLRDEDEVFFVFLDRGFRRSVREELPPVRGTAVEQRIAAIRAARPDARLRWTAAPGPDDLA